MAEGNTHGFVEETEYVRVLWELTDFRETETNYIDARAHWQVEYSRRTLQMREGLLKFLMWAFGISLAVTLPTFVVVLVLDGWSARTGFDTSDKVIFFLGGINAVEVAALLTTAITSFLGARGMSE